MGKDYNNMLAWKKNLPTIAMQVGCGKDLQLKANELKRQFLDFMAETACQNDKFVQWSSDVFEKNSVGSPLFLYVCYLDILRDCLNEYRDAESIIVVSESWALMHTIKDNLSYGDYEIITLYNINMSLSVIKNFIRIAGRPFAFIYRSLHEYIVTKSTSQQLTDKNAIPQNGKNVLIRTWVNDKFFDKGGNFRDAYFNALSGWLIKNGYNVRVLPLIMDAKVLGKENMHFLRNEKNRFLMAWDYLKPIDIFRSLIRGVGQLKLKFAKKDFKGWNIGELLKDERYRFALSRRGLNCILHYYLFERLAKSSVRIDRIIYTFENMLPEKLLIIAMRKFYPDAVIVGFQHSVLYPLHLTLYISKYEADKAPLPDRIVCSGKFFKEILSKEFYPENILRIGPALRFGYLFDGESENMLYGNKFAVVLPGYKSEALYLLIKTLTALRDDTVVVHVKPHPLTDLNDVYKTAEKVGFPKDRIVIEKQTLKELMKQSSAVITVASSVIYDAIASGVPVIRVKKEIDLDLDPADWLEYNADHDFIAFSTEDIKGEVKRALTLNSDKRKELISYSRQFVEETFSPITDETLSVFIN